MTAPDDRLLSAWLGDLPGQEALGRELLKRWSEPQRRYHDGRHLSEALAALEALGGSRLERVAIWFHDAVWRGEPDDERRSADLADARLRGILAPDEVAEVARLIMITRDHRPEPGDQSGARVGDADLAILGSPPGRYRQSVAELRVESGLDEAAWVRARAAAVARLLARPAIYATDLGRQRWEAAARRNLASEG